MKNQTLANLPMCMEAYIDTIGVGGELRRRLLDLGFSTGNSVTPLFQSPLGDPTAYFVMGSVIALRREDADKICVAAIKKEGL